MWSTILMVVLMVFIFDLKLSRELKNMEDRSMAEKFIIYFIVTPILLLLLVRGVMYFWSISMIPIFGLSEISIQQTLALMLVLRILIPHNNGEIK